ncbi:MAG: hypothetical protein GX107_08810 [Clostridiales bacterium]|jgi:hypothetical protein|nr:hypothetical protein [Clostridiales bacterium]
MNKIILFGNREDTGFTLPLCRSLAKNGGALYLGSGCISEYSSVSPEFTVFETDRLDVCNADKTVIIFKGGTPEPSFAPCDKVSVIAESGNAPAERFTSKHSLLLTTYGMNPDSCVSASSIGEKQAVVSVRRGVELISGKALEPCELTVKYSLRPDSFVLLPLCAVMILCEKFKDSEISL